MEKQLIFQNMISKVTRMSSQLEGLIFKTWRSETCELSLLSLWNTFIYVCILKHAVRVGQSLIYLTLVVHHLSGHANITTYFVGFTTSFLCW